MTAADTPVLSVRGLTIDLPSGGDRRSAVESVSFDLAAGEILCVVGESGSGKSATAFAVMNLLARELDVSAGQILFKGQDLLTLPAEARRTFSGQSMSMIFQEPMTALNPVYSIGHQVEEVLVIHQPDMSRATRHARMLETLRAVNLPDPVAIAKAYPHQISGGQRQRVMIAMALILNPSVLIADEPTTALDVTTQAQILKLIDTLRHKRGAGVLFITHDIGVVREIADRVIVMRGGRVIEAGPAAKVLDSPTQDYTRQLIDAVPPLQAPPPRAPVQGRPLLNIAGLDKTYGKGLLAGRRIAAVADVDLTVAQGEVLSIVGESGSGKSTLARIVAGLVPPSSGTIDLPKGGAADARGTRVNKVQMVFQDPNRSLNPRLRIGASLIEGPMNAGLSRAEAMARGAALIARVGLEPSALQRYPHQFSGGQRQRICIARALAMEPDLLIADEAVSALDMTVQNQVLDLLEELQRELGLGMIFITHDLRVAARISDRICVMQKGRIVEQGTAAKVLANPKSAYTQQLLDAMPGRAAVAKIAAGI
ncbi:dipeptide ABC transporter ATP-binding protein [Chachezhania sediminis]|uniref:dipeptide ABC transporter ATP-binding protein n=1 Tax=Chachezhania sediminis TaxID=2599291 RepID=UPI00131B8C60|nr:ABC transporter ATP-binding protein [Chachezhania sediminis]